MKRMIILSLFGAAVVCWASVGEGKGPSTKAAARPATKPATKPGEEWTAQKSMDRARRRDEAYNKAYQAGENLKAWHEMHAAIAAYADGAAKFPTNTGFNMGAGVFLNVEGLYAQGAKFLEREWAILGDFQGAEWEEAKYITAEQLALSYEHEYDFERAVEFYRLAGQHKEGDAKAVEGVARCRENRLEFSELPGWVAKAAKAGGGVIEVDYAATPRTYPGFERCQYRLEARGGKAYVSVSVPLLYRGTQANRPNVLRRLDQAIAKTRECYRRSGIELELGYRMVKTPRDLPEEHGVMIWDHYRPLDMRVGDARNWAILTAREFPLTVEVAASTISHEVGHMLGLGHPAYYPDEPYTDVMTAGYPWNDVSSKRVFPGDVKQILGPLLYPAGKRDVLAKASVLHAAGKHAQAAALLGEAARGSPRDFVLATAAANGLFDAGDFAAAATAYTRLLALRPKDCGVMYFRGVSRSRAGQWRKAIEDFSYIVGQHSGGLHAAAYFERAEAHEKLGDKAAAAADRLKSQQALTAPDKEATPPASQPAKP